MCNISKLHRCNRKEKKMLRKKKRIEALEKRVTDLETKPACFDKESATQLFKIMKQKNEEFRKNHHFSAFSQQ